MPDLIRSFAQILGAAAGNPDVTDDELHTLVTIVCKLAAAAGTSAPRTPKRPANPQ